MAYELAGTIFNIQKFSIHDGDGIRTLIFMKGCPLACLWCSNPESQSADIKVMDVKSNCTGCGKCAVLCEYGAVQEGSFDIDRSLCQR
ncbi:MAG: 4Fe-4S binding protein [Firmicutes bacterium]|nr:4Fe-4S binding protein [Bacillota bacterium]